MVIEKRGIIGLDGGGNFEPTQISGLQLWLAADRITGLNDGDPVTTWLDLSGNGNNASQGTAAKKPTYETNEINSKPAVEFDGVDDNLPISNLALLRNLPGVTSFLVIRYLVATSTKVAFGASVTGGGGARFAQGVGVVSGQYHTNARRLDADASSGQNYGSVDISAFLIHSVVMDCIVGTHTSYINGAQIATNSLASSGGNISNTDSLTIAVGSLANTDYSRSKQSELILYNRALTIVEQKRVELALSQKYAIPVS